MQVYSTSRCCPSAKIFSARSTSLNKGQTRNCQYIHSLRLCKRCRCLRACAMDTTLQHSRRSDARGISRTNKLSYLQTRAHDARTDILEARVCCGVVQDRLSATRSRLRRACWQRCELPFSRVKLSHRCPGVLVVLEHLTSKNPQWERRLCIHSRNDRRRREISVGE